MKAAIDTTNAINQGLAAGFHAVGALGGAGVASFAIVDLELI
jgi:hypothetical protein